MEHWQHQIDPSISRGEWSEFEIQTLFQTQAKLSNKWAQISVFLLVRTENALKNFFYSQVRRILTKINPYVSKQKNRIQFKTISQFFNNYLSELIVVADGNFEKRVRLSNPEISQSAKKILKRITNFFSGQIAIYDKIKEFSDYFIFSMQQFRKCCRKRKQVNHKSDDESHADDETQWNKISLQRNKIKSALNLYIRINNVWILQRQLPSNAAIHKIKKQQRIKNYINNGEYSFNFSRDDIQMKKIENFQFSFPKFHSSGNTQREI